MKQACLYLITILIGLWFLPKYPERTPSSIQSAPPLFSINGFEQDLDLSQPQDLIIFKAYIDRMLSEIELDTPQLWGPIYFRDHTEISKKKLKKILEYMRSEDDPEKLAMIHRSLELNYRPPLKEHYSIGEIATKTIKDVLINPFIKGKTPAKNIKERDVSDQGLLDPIESYLWKRPLDLQNQNLFWGFNRPMNLNTHDNKCQYKEAKTSWGIKPGFTVKCDHKKIKIKFGEIHTEAFASRIFWALGFNTEAVDYQPYMKLDYNRKIFTEFNIRRPIEIKIKLLGLKVSEKILTKFSDPFNFIKEAVLTDGRIMSGTELKTFLLKNPSIEKASDFDDNYIAENESQIKELTTLPIQVQESVEDQLRVGPWDWNDFNFKDKREMRAIVLLAGWLTWFDVRFDNNRLLIEDNQFKLAISDTGSVIGKSTTFLPLFRNTIEDFNSLTEDFTEGNPKKSTFTIKKFRLVDPVGPFNDATIDDIKWIARLIRSLTSKQIADALKAAGFSHEEQEMGLNKLLKRREKMLKDLGL